MIGLADPVGCPALVNWSGGHSAIHIIAIRMVPPTAAIRRPMPNINVMPRPARASMNPQSTHPSPAIERNIAWNGPWLLAPRNPAVGEPPLIQALILGVE